MLFQYSHTFTVHYMFQSNNNTQYSLSSALSMLTVVVWCFLGCKLCETPMLLYAHDKILFTERIKINLQLTQSSELFTHIANKGHALCCSHQPKKPPPLSHTHYLLVFVCVVRKVDQGLQSFKNDAFECKNLWLGYVLTTVCQHYCSQYY